MRHLTCALVLLLSATAYAADAKPLLDDGAFGPTASETTRYLHFEVTQPGKLETRYAQAHVGAAKALELTYRVRYAGVVRGEKPWFDARVLIEFKDAAGTKLPSSVPTPSYVGSSQGWKLESLRFAVPPGAVFVAVMPALFQATAGSMDVADVLLVAIDPATLPPTAAPEPTSPVDAGGKPPKALHVDGRLIKDADGAEQWLQGVAVPSLEWSDGGEHVVASIAAAIELWKARIIRLPVSGKRWFGKESSQSDGGVAYRALVAQAVKAASSRGAYIIVDLHHYRAPSDDDVAFWKDAAADFKNDPAVLFGLLNEPHDISWAIWRDGGLVEDRKQGGDALAENKEAVTSFRTPGMQALVAAVRGTGAKNIVLAGGLDWAYDLSGVIDGHALDDLGGNGVVYDSHVYSWKSDWRHRFLDPAEKVPVLLGEVGCDAKRYDFIPAERFESPYTWAPDMLACIQKHHLHWAAWSFHPGAGPAMLMDARDWTPTPFWGTFVRAALLGARFESDKQR